MNTLTDGITAVQTTHRQHCVVAINFASDEFSDQDRSVLADPKVTDTLIVKGLAHKGITTSTAAVHNHRHGQCRCDPSETPQLSEGAVRQAKKAHRNTRVRRNAPGNTTSRTLNI